MSTDNRPCRLADLVKPPALISVAVAAPNRIPETCLGLACLVAPDGRLRVFVQAAQAAQVLAAVADGWPNFSVGTFNPADLGTFLVQGTAPRLEKVQATELAAMAAAVLATRTAMGTMGFSQAWSDAFFGYLEEEISCVSFRVEKVLLQTPGAHVGELVPVLEMSQA